MEIKKGQNVPVKGMNRDLHKSELSEDMYSFALNSNTEDASNKGFQHKNEASNIKCTSFKEGYKVVGYKHHLNKDRIYFFLVNPDTNCSEIGYINVILNEQLKDAIEKSCGCDFQVILDHALEDITQHDSCEYVTIISDFCEDTHSCTGCLNFSLENPIYESNIHIKEELLGTNLYWTDGNRNPPRYIQLDYLAQYTTDEFCNEPSVTTCLQCDKLRIFPLYNQSCIKVRELGNGGTLRGGSYEILYGYSDVNGELLTNVSSLTLPTPIFDENNTILDQTNLDYETTKSIAVEILDLDTNFKYYTVYVVYRSGLNAQVNYVEYGTFPITQSEVVIHTIQGKKLIPSADLFSIRPTYDFTRGMSSANNTFFQYGLTTKKEVNFQPMANLLGCFAKWGTVMATEDLYLNGANVSNYKSAMRDEVYPYSIRFSLKGGFKTALFDLIPRPPIAEEEDVLDTEDFPANTGTNSLLATLPQCDKNNRTKRWQFENTASVEGFCPEPAEPTDTETYVQFEEFECTIGGETPTVLDTIASGTLPIPNGQDIVDYINFYRSQIITNNDPDFADVIDILTDPASYTGECTPEVDSNCDTPTTPVDDGEMFVIGVDSVSTVVVEQEYEDYERLSPPSVCNNLKLDSNGDAIEYTTFVTDYLPTGSTVYEKYTTFTNTNCNVANPLPTQYSPVISNPTFLVDQGTIDTNTALRSSTVSTTTSTTVVRDFTDRIHTNALWFKVDFNGRSKVIVELSPNFCATSDDNTLNEVRVSFFNSCTSASMSTYDVILDTTTFGDTNKFITLNASDFTGTAYIAIDSPIVSRDIADYQGSGVLRTTYTLSPFCGCMNIQQKDVKSIEKISFTNMTFGKKLTYSVECTYTYPKLDGCDPVPYNYGKFGYWESVSKYPCNSELFDSSTLVIEQADIPIDYRADFESYYVNSISSGTYVLNSATNFKDRPIRHYKFPCSGVSPFMGIKPTVKSSFSDSIIYPIGFNLNNEIINAFLDIAVKNNLLSLEDRNNITGYEIFRGSRVNNKSVVSKGLLFDMYSYTDDSDQVLYPNYPLNNLGHDILNNRNHPYAGIANHNFTYHSPDHSFYKPTLTREIKLEGYQMGKGQNFYDEVKGYPTYVVLGTKAYTYATLLSVLEVAFEVFIQSGDWAVSGSAGGVSAPASIAVASIAIVGLAVQAVYRVGQYRYQWLTTFRDLGKPENLAYYQTLVGKYNYFLPQQKQYRGLTISSYMRDGRFEFTDEVNQNLIKVNNYKREHSVFLSLSETAFAFTYPDEYRLYDNSGKNSSRRISTKTGRTQFSVTNVASPYIAMKQYRPDQYGNLSSIEWVNTNYCGNLNEDNTCDHVFGGDIFISRFSLKRKFPVFTTDAFGLAPLTPFKHSDYFNVNPDDSTARYYLDYLLSDDELTFGAVVFPSNRSRYNLFSSDLNYDSSFYIKPPSKFITSSYGIPYFLVESEINCNYRYAKREKFENFYPNVGDVVDWTQEEEVPLKEQNTYFYNNVYSSLPTPIPYRKLPEDYSKAIYDLLGDESNSVIYSQSDNTETTLSDPWLNYKALDYYHFQTSFGKLVSMDEIESNQILARFENGFTIFGAIDQIRDRLTPEIANLGNGGIFAGRPINFNITDLGYAGTQHRTLVSCEFGHFWVDAVRGKVFNLKPNGSGLEDITVGLQKWFRKHLPMQLSKYIDGIDIDNTFNGAGIILGWDAQSRRLFLIKKDYKPKFPTTYENGQFVVGSQPRGFEPIKLTDSKYFEDCSFTVAYSPEKQSWISYYSFKPDYFISLNESFKTGLNNSFDPTEAGLWTHYPEVGSYQVFYGKRYPWTVEYVQKSNGYNGFLNDIEYWLDAKRWYNNYDYADIVGVSFDQVVISNNQQNSGQIKMTVQTPNDVNQRLRYPKWNAEDVEILQTEMNGRYTFNYFYNLIRREKSGLPIWMNDCVEVGQTLEHKLLDYRPTQKDRLRGDWFAVRLSQTLHSRYQMNFRFSKDTRTYYEQ